MTLLDLDLKSLSALGGVLAAIVAFFVRQNSRIERCALAEKVAARDREIDAELDRKASKAEVIEHASQLAEHREAIATIRAEMSAVTKGIDGMRDDMRRLGDKLDRLLEQERSRG